VGPEGGSQAPQGAGSSSEAFPFRVQAWKVVTPVMGKSPNYLSFLACAVVSGLAYALLSETSQLDHADDNRCNRQNTTNANSKIGRTKAS